MMKIGCSSYTPTQFICTVALLKSFVADHHVITNYIRHPNRFIDLIYS